jgi:sterol 3beta-glucosyltransferase
LQQRSTRVADGVEDFGKSSEEERQRIMAKFKAMTTPEVLRQRRKGLTDAAKAAMEQSHFQAFDNTATSSSTSTSLPKTPSSNIQETSEVVHSTALRQDGNNSEEENFQRDLELAKQLSLAEQRGYERAMAERLHDI